MSNLKYPKHEDPLKKLVKLHKPDKPDEYRPGVDLRHADILTNESYWINLLDNTSIKYKNDLREYLLSRLEETNYGSNVDIFDNNSYSQGMDYKKHIPAFFKAFELLANDTFAKAIIHTAGTLKKRPSSSNISTSRNFITTDLSSENALLLANKYFEVLIQSLSCNDKTSLRIFHSSTQRRSDGYGGYSESREYIMDSSRGCFDALLDNIHVKDQETIMLKYMYLADKQNTFERYPLLKKYKVLESFIDDSISLGDLFNFIDNQVKSKKIKPVKPNNQIDFATALPI